MARPLRITYEGAWYHVMNRGLARNQIFLNDDHRRYFLDLLYEINIRYQVQIHAYCLMGNHYHLFIRTPKANISRAMRHLDGVYTQYFNKSSKRDGPIFRGRFKSILVDADVYLLRLSRYIHLNPVKAEMVKKLEEYDWSSYRYYLNGNEPVWLTTATTLSYFGERMQREKYAAFLNEGIDDEIQSFYSHLKKIPILGAEAFIKTITLKYLHEEYRIDAFPEHHLIKKSMAWDINKIANVVAGFYKISLVDIKVAKKGVNNTPRLVCIYLCHVFGNHKASEIAAWFTGIKPRSVSQVFLRAKKTIDKSPELSCDLGNILSILNGDVLAVGT